MTKFRTASVAGLLAITAEWTVALAQTPTAEVMSLGLRGVYVVENQGQWTDASVEYGFKTRGLDIAFREASFTMHLSRETGSTSRACEEAALGVGRDAPLFDSHGTYSLASDYDNRLVGAAAAMNVDRDAPLPHGRGSSGASVQYEHLTLTVTFPGANPVLPRGAQPQAAKFNYYIGDDESRWASDVPSYAAIIYENLYDDVDLHICGNDDGVLKYEFHVAPGADWNQIRIAYDGIESLCVEESGDLRIKTSFGTLMDSAPVVWQEDVDFTSRAREEAGSAPSPGSAGEGRGGGAFTNRADSTSRAREVAVLDVASDAPLPDRRGSSDPTIPARFELVDATTYRFALDGPVDPARVLIIDPDVEWMVYLGGSEGNDSAEDLALDRNGNLLIVGDTTSNDLVGRNNSPFDSRCAFVGMVSPDGDLRWTTYFGGAGQTYGAGIGVASDFTIVIGGTTDSPFLAGRRNESAGRDDAYVAKFRQDGTLLASRYLGGQGDDRGKDIVIGPNDEVYVVGDTNSEDFEGAIHKWYGWVDGFISRIGHDGTVEWTRFLGGSRVDDATCVTIDDSLNVQVGGTTSSGDFFGRINEWPNHQQAFVAKLRGNGDLLWALYVGGWYRNQGRGVAADSAGNIFLVGMTKDALNNNMVISGAVLLGSSIRRGTIAA